MDTKLSSQMLKGILSGSILVLLEREKLYGYTLSQKLTAFGFQNVPMGTIYPLLLSLEKKGFIYSTSENSESGPPRKYYRLTQAGKAEKENFINQWQQLRASVDALTLNDDNMEDKENGN